MRELEGTLSELPAPSIVRSLYLTGRTGELVLRDSDREESYFVVAGELYLPPDHPLASPAGLVLRSRRTPVPGAPAGERAAPGGSAAAAGSVEVDLRQLARGLAEAMEAWKEGSYRFVEGTRKISTDLVGPLPTALVVMEGATWNRDEFQLLRQLGGEECRFAAFPEGGRREVDLDPQEAFLLSRLERPVTVKELVRQVEEKRRVVLEKLCRLQAVDLVRPYEEAQDRDRAEAVGTQLIARLAERVGEELERKPLVLPAEEHRRRLKELLQKLGELDHYELLGVELGASQAELHTAYHQLARMVHPAHAERLRLRQGRAGLELLFERATDAYLTLSDPDRSRRYHDRMGSVAPGMRPRASSEERVKERQALAARQFKVARSLCDQEDFHAAIQLLEQAVRLDPRPEYLALLGRSEARNPRWLTRAALNLSRAVEQRPEDPELRTDLARVYEEAGNPARAREEYQAALERMPGFPDAVAGLQRLASAPGPGQPSGGLVRRLLSRFGRG